MSDKNATCRNCGKILNGKPYHLGGHAYHPETKEKCKVNYYGGFVCSESCDRRASLDLESSMPGAGEAKSLSSQASISIMNNWRY